MLGTAEGIALRDDRDSRAQPDPRRHSGRCGERHKRIERMPVFDRESWSAGPLRPAGCRDVRMFRKEDRLEFPFFRCDGGLNWRHSHGPACPFFRFPEPIELKVCRKVEDAERRRHALLPVVASRALSPRIPIWVKSANMST